MNKNFQMENLYTENELRGEDKKIKKKFNFNLYKKNTIKSLNEVEFFLNNFGRISKYLKLYKILK